MYLQKTPTEVEDVLQIYLERDNGFEPMPEAWKAAVLPLHQSRVVEATGFEPATPWSQTKCATGLRYASKRLTIV